MGDLSHQFNSENKNHLFQPISCFESHLHSTKESITDPPPSLIFGVLSPSLWYGYRGCCLFYRVRQRRVESNKIDYILEESPKLLQMWKQLVCIFLCFALLSQHMWGNTIGDSFFLVSLIRKIMIIIVVLYILATLYCFHFKKHILIEILKQGHYIEKQFASLGIKIPYSFRDVRLMSKGMTFTFFIFCILHRILNTLKYDYKIDWFEQPAQGLLRLLSVNFVLFSSDLIHRETPYYFYQIIGLLGIILETIAFNIWYFGELFLLLLTAIMWQTFTSIRNSFKEADKSGFPKFRNNLSQLIELHFQATKMMDTINDLTSTITLFSAAFIIFYMCYWLNYTILEHTFRPHHLAMFVFIFKSSATLLMQADINHKAHDVPEWLLRRHLQLGTERVATLVRDGSLGCENEPTSSATSLGTVNVFLFASQLYGRHEIGFKGYFFITVTPSFVSKIAGLILTYTIVVTQFYLKDPKCTGTELLTNNATTLFGPTLQETSYETKTLP